MRTRNWVALVAGTILALISAYSAYQLADFSWAQVVDYRSPYVESPLPETEVVAKQDVWTAFPEISDTRLVLVIVDGLREDTSRKMPTLTSLRERGYDSVVRTFEPSLSFPNWTTLLSGAPQRISGVTTNWFEGRVPVETIIDVGLRAGSTVAVAGPTDFEELFAVKRTGHTFLKDWTEGHYLAGELVDGAIGLVAETSATVVLVHVPDVDEAGHHSGGASKEYESTALKVDKDIGRLVEATDNGRTVFVVVSDHGHVDAGGHGGPEPEVTEVPAVFAGFGVNRGQGRGYQDQVAPTLALLASLPAPRHATGRPLPVTSASAEDEVRFDIQYLRAFEHYRAVVTGEKVSASATPTADARTKADQAGEAFDAATVERLEKERADRLPMALGLAGACLIVVAVIGIMSWRALLSAAAGTVGYYVVYLGLFLGVHRAGWSLSAFNSEDVLKSFFNGRMIETVVAGVAGAFIAAEVYLVSRRDQERAKGEHLPRWLALGTATTLTIQATLGLQVALYLWVWGARVTWILPEFQQAFKYDLDLIQITALGAVALLAPVLTFLVGRYHPMRTAVSAEAPSQRGRGRPSRSRRPQAGGRPVDRRR